MADRGKFKLSYFNGSGRGEQCRWILAYAKAPFEDNRVARADWSKLKPSMPLGQMPVLDFTCAKSHQNMIMCQSGAIVRFLADLFELSGKNPVEKGRANEAYESLREFLEASFMAMFEQDQVKKGQMMEKLKTETGPRILGFLEKRLGENKGKNLAGGDAYTFADIFVGSCFDTLNMMKVCDLSPYPGLNALAKAIADSDGVKAYLAKRPKPEM